MLLKEALKILKAKANPKNVEGMARFGINPKNTLGIPLPFIRSMGKKIGKDHRLALDLWKSGIHEARILATIIDDAKLVTEDQMGKWVKDFDSWDVCDQCCMNLFRKTGFAYKKVFEWSSRKEEFIKRAAFALIATLAVHDKKADDKTFTRLFPLIKRASIDDRNFVRKAVNWALRQIGKRSRKLQKEAIKLAQDIEKIDSSAAKWVAKDALRELRSKVL